MVVAAAGSKTPTERNFVSKAQICCWLTLAGFAGNKNRRELPRVYAPLVTERAQSSVQVSQKH